MFELEKALVSACKEASGFPEFNYQCDQVTKKAALFTACIGTAKIGGGGGGGRRRCRGQGPRAGAGAGGGGGGHGLRPLRLNATAVQGRMRASKHVLQRHAAWMAASPGRRAARRHGDVCPARVCHPPRGRGGSRMVHTHRSP